MMIESLPARSKDMPEAESYIHSTGIGEVYGKYADMIFKVCFSYMKNAADAEDIVADVFVKLINSGVKFKSGEHEKAWLLRTAINLCKNNLKHWRRKCEDIAQYGDIQGGESQTDGLTDANETLSAVMQLPERHKAVVYLYYYEGYDTAEIAKILKKPHSTVRVHLHEARKLLRKVLGENEE